MKNKNWMLIIRVFLLVGGLFAFPALTFGADAAPPPPPKWYDTISMNGFVDGYYSYNANTQTGLNTYHNFDYKANDLNVSLMELNIVKAVDDKNKAGFYLGLAFGEAADAIACGTCAVNTSTGVPPAEAAYKNFRQAYASLLLRPNLQLDFGKFVTQHGAEVIESKDNWNYTRSLLFSWAIPYYHSGARLTYTLNDKVTLMGDVVNGWNNVAETNSGKTYGVQAAVTPVKSLPIVINYMTGPENVGTISDTRSLLDVVATYNVSDSLAFMANYDSGTQKQAAGAGSADATWSGWAVYGRYAISPTYAAAVRYEQFDDNDGFTTGTVQNLSEGTLTLEYSGFGPGSLIRLDLRQDMSDKKPFPKDGSAPTDSQLTATLGIVQTF